MGRNKALLPLPGTQSIPFITHLSTVLSATCHELILVARDQDQADVYIPHVPRNFCVVTDRIPDIGPLMGLYSGLSIMKSPHALVTAVDLPLLQPALVSFLLAQAVDDDRLLIPRVSGLAQVLLAVYPRRVLTLIEARLQEGRRDPRSLLDVAAVNYIEEDQLRRVDPQLISFRNINTPDEFATLG